ncbi:trans-aconitate methyltransferase [Rhodoligotrophos appendicifer]|uniref:class I SAM-dependent methyltransferase n=1 Tax=Rhodoligotrophos appendicifer TaxID=987056 RepID=UPI0011860189|nr:class I SAM-dependent methyltransferase [Rhodoligotrophos appendicifer]
MTDQAREQTWSAETYGAHARFVSDLAGPVLEWLAPRPGERILDLGCGDGVLTQALGAMGVDMVGVDASEDFIRAARARGVDARLMDGEKLDFRDEFDAVFSNAALHWMTRPAEVLRGVAGALKPGGRFVAEFGGHTNVAAIITAMRAVAARRSGDPDLAGPWFFPTPEEYSALLVTHGFGVKRIGLFGRPTPLKSGMAAWLQVFRKPFFQQFGAESDAVLAEVVDLLAPTLRDGAGNWTADYMRIRVEAALK